VVSPVEVIRNDNQLNYKVTPLVERGESISYSMVEFSLIVSALSH
jgi:hypothetical protein